MYTLHALDNKSSEEKVWDAEIHTKLGSWENLGENFSNVMRLSRDSFIFSDSQSIAFPSASASEGVQ